MTAVDFIPVGMALITFAYFYLAVNFKKKHPALQIFFMIAGLLTVLLNYALMSEIATSATEAGIADLLDRSYWFNIIILITTVLYFMLMLIKEVLLSFLKKR